jgi:VIT1/CCC1 family predicted Fe2+/Mn2+ transporter
MFGAFHLGGIPPILPYFVKDRIISSSAAIGMTIRLSSTSSFIVGAIKSRMAKKNWVRGGIEMTGLGTGVALVDYGKGSELNKVGLVQTQVIFHEQIP